MQNHLQLECGELFESFGLGVRFVYELYGVRQLIAPRPKMKPTVLQEVVQSVDDP